MKVTNSLCSLFVFCQAFRSALSLGKSCKQQFVGLSSTLESKDGGFMHSERDLRAIPSASGRSFKYRSDLRLETTNSRGDRRCLSTGGRLEANSGLLYTSDCDCNRRG